MDYKKFYEYFATLYGTGLEVENWHLNGDTEPFDNFFDAAVEESTYDPKELWEEFGDIPMNPETECIEVSWRGFPAGTHREEIWHWFEETFNVRVHDMMYGRRWERHMDWYTEFNDRLRDYSEGDIWSNGGDEIMCRTESAANAIADLIESLYRSQGEDIVVNTGYYDPEEDKRNNETDRCTGWWYINMG